MFLQLNYIYLSSLMAGFMYYVSVIHFLCSDPVKYGLNTVFLNLN